MRKGVNTAIFIRQTCLGSNMVRAELANQILARTFFRSLAHLFACPAAGKFSRASSAGGRRHLRLNFVNQIVSVAEDCLSPERTFHGCPLMHFRDCICICITDSNPFCVPSRWKVLSGEFRRRPTEFVNRFRKSDRVGRRGLSEPREDFSRLTTYAIPWLYQYL